MTSEDNTGPKREPTLAAHVRLVSRLIKESNINYLDVEVDCQIAALAELDPAVKKGTPEYRAKAFALINLELLQHTTRSLQIILLVR